MAADTHVWVVKTVLASTASLAVSKSTSASRMSLRMRSSTRRAECPSFMWKTSGATRSASRARMPPMARMASCCRRTRGSAA